MTALVEIFLLFCTIDQTNIFFNGTAIDQFPQLGTFVYNSCNVLFSPANGTIVEFCLEGLVSVFILWSNIIHLNIIGNVA